MVWPGSAARDNFDKGDDLLNENEVGKAAMESLRDGDATTLDEVMRRANEAASELATPEEALHVFRSGEACP